MARRTRDELVKAALRRSRENPNNAPAIAAMHDLVLDAQDYFVSYHRWPWRRRVATFNTVAGNPYLSLGTDASSVEQAVGQVHGVRDKVDKRKLQWFARSDFLRLYPGEHDSGRPSIYTDAPFDITNGRPQIQVYKTPDAVYELTVDFDVHPRATVTISSKQYLIVPEECEEAVILIARAKLFEDRGNQFEERAWQAAEREIKRQLERVEEGSSEAHDHVRAFTPDVGGAEDY